MQCPKCGYVMGDLETECLRCKRAGAGAVVSAPPERPVLLPLPPALDEKECPRCGKATMAAAPTCDKCGYEYQPDVSRSERYQALLAEEEQIAPLHTGLRRTVPPALSWSIIGASILAMGIAGWAMFGGALTGEGDADSMASLPITALTHHRFHRGALHTVNYQVTGTASGATITYQGSDGSRVSLPDSVTLPWTETFKAKTGTSLSVSAKSSDPAAAVTVEIDVDGVPQKQAKTADADGSTTAAATL